MSSVIEQKYDVYITSIGFNWINAIKALRTIYGCSLQTGKDIIKLVENIENPEFWLEKAVSFNRVSVLRDELEPYTVLAVKLSEENKAYEVNPMLVFAYPPKKIEPAHVEPSSTNFLEEQDNDAPPATIHDFSFTQKVIYRNALRILYQQMPFWFLKMQDMVKCSKTIDALTKAIVEEVK